MHPGRIVTSFVVGTERLYKFVHDNPIVECAVAAKADTIVTGDAHLLSLGSFRGIKIQRVAEFLAEGRSR